MSTQDRAEAQDPVRGRMGFDEREMMMMYLLRHPGVFLEAKQVLTPSHFTEPYEIIWAVSWQSALDLYDQYGHMPPYEILEADALSRVEENPGSVPANGIEELREFLASVFGATIDLVHEQHSAYGYDLLEKFLKERHWMDSIRQRVADLGDNTPIDLPQLMQDFQTRLSQVNGVRCRVTDDLIPENWDQSSLTLIPTGMDFLDEPMGGGWANGEVYGLLGTFGSGKTMMACQLAAAVARHFAHVARMTGEPPRRVHYFTYETPPDDIRRRIIANVATILLDHLNLVPYHETLSRIGRRHPYEETLFTADPWGEWERYQSQVMPIRNLIRVSDLRGGPSNPKAGTGWIDEIRAELERDARVTGILPGFVILDYALVATKRYLRARGLDPDRQLRHFMGSFGDEARRMVADHFGCGVWILNQLSGVANRRAPTARMNHADSAEATNFAENLWYAACLGNKDRKTNGVVLDFTKTRRSQGNPDPIVLKLEGHLARFVAAGSDLMIDPNAHRLVARSRGRVAAPQGFRLPPPQTSGGSSAVNNPGD